jgi:hypothetical protein
MKGLPRRHLLLAVTLIALLVGCDEDKRVSQVATEAADRQAEQNREIAYQNRQVSGTTQALVEADARSRKELIALQQQLEAEQAEVAKGRDQLEAERKEIATQRERDPIIAAAITGTAVLLACLLPAVICWHLLRTAHDEKADPELTEVLIAELVTEPRSPFALPRGSSALIAEPVVNTAIAGPFESDMEGDLVD